MVRMEGNKIHSRMEYAHYAAIDIGSNAVRLLIKRLDDDARGQFSKDVMMRVPLRLGQDVFTKGRVSAKKIRHLTELMRAFKIVMGIYEVKEENSRVCATCALREAANAEDIVRAIREEAGLEVEVISGKEEAAIVCGLRSPQDKRKLVYVDVGGGSTEVSILSGGRLFDSKSYPIGTVKIINRVEPGNWRVSLTTDLRALATKFAIQNHSNATMTNATIVGAGGNINKLFALAQERDPDEQSMPVRQLRLLYDSLASMTVSQRMTRYKLKADRADVIVPAAEIFLTIADALGISEIEIPSDGLADGIIVGIWQKQKKIEMI